MRHLGRYGTGKWCGRRESNPHSHGEEDFKSPASTVPPRPLYRSVTIATSPGLFRRNLAKIQTLAHFLARLEIRHALCIYRDRFAGARISTHTRIALPS